MLWTELYFPIRPNLKFPFPDHMAIQNWTIFRDKIFKELISWNEVIKVDFNPIGFIFLKEIWLEIYYKG